MVIGTQQTHSYCPFPFLLALFVAFPQGRGRHLSQHGKGAAQRYRNVLVYKAEHQGICREDGYRVLTWSLLANSGGQE